MGDEGGDKPFSADRGKREAGCKRCRGKIQKGTLRIAKYVTNAFSDNGGLMKTWHHPRCIFDSFLKARATTRIIEEPEDDIEGWDKLVDEDKEEIQNLLKETLEAREQQNQQKTSSKKTPTSKSPASKPKIQQPATSSKNLTPFTMAKSPKKVDIQKPEDNDNCHKDKTFRQFRQVCAVLADTPAYGEKSSYLRKFLDQGSDGKKFEGDVVLWIRMLLPDAKKRIYNLQSIKLIKIFSKIFGTSLEEMEEDLKQGDVAKTIKTFYEQSKIFKPNNIKVDEFLEQLSGVRSEEEQLSMLKGVAKKCTSNDLQMVIRLIKHDLRINARAAHILDGLHPDAYNAFQNSRDLDAVVGRVLEVKKSGKKDGASLDIGISLMTPIKPMLAEVCKSVEQAMSRCPNGFFSEVKYDGERVQVHKKGNDFKYFSRSLKAVVPNKVKELTKYLPKAFPHGHDLIIDSEILLMDTQTGNPLPFGTLGVHKKAEFKNASVCLFVFDCIYYNGQVLLKKTMKERRQILHENMTEIPYRVVFSEQKEIKNKKELEKMIAKVLSKGLEGLVLKDIGSTYEPGKRHWLKIKKDYLCGGAMADSADLVPLGAWFGTGNKGGIMSIFLMCTFDPIKNRWVSVTKVHSGFTDEELDKLQTELQMVRFNKDTDILPKWLNISRPFMPDFIAVDPEDMPVWEIAGAEFTKLDSHTSGISIRFPRFIKFRDDKTYKESTNLQELQVLFDNSRTADAEEIASKISNDIGETKRAFPTKKIKTDVKIQPSPQKGLDKYLKRIDKTDSQSPEKKGDERGIDKPIKTENKKEENKKASTSSDKSKTSSKKESPLKTGIDKYLKTEEKPGPSKRNATSINENINFKKQKLEIEKPLPDIFTGVHMIIPEWASTKNNILRRYFIAYGGNLLQNHKALAATHCIYDKSHPPKTISSNKCSWITTAWLWDSIREQKLQPTVRYAPKT